MKEVKIDYTDKEGKEIKGVFKLKKMTFKEANDLTKSYMQIQIIGSDVRTNFDYGALMEQTVLKGLEKAPFEITIENVQNLPSDVGEKLFKEIESYNKMDGLKKKDLKVPLKTEQQIQK